MYQGKHIARKEKKKTAASHRKRKAALILSLVLMLGAAIGGTMAYFTDNTASNSSFSVGQVSCSASWDESKNSYIINNDGTVPASVRVAVVANWENQDGLTHWTKPNARIKFDNGVWTEHDGYYYCNAAIGAKDEVTGPEVEILDPAPNGYSAKIQILVEAVQENSDAWVFTPSGN